MESITFDRKKLLRNGFHKNARVEVNVPAQKKSVNSFSKRILSYFGSPFVDDNVIL